jgi:PAS domain S-box-containing protein
MLERVQILPALSLLDSESEVIWLGLVAVAVMALASVVISVIALARRGRRERDVRELVLSLEEMRSGKHRRRPDVSARSTLSLVADAVNRLGQDMSVGWSEYETSSARLEALLQADSDAGVVVTDGEMTIRSFSPGAASLFGWTTEDVVGSQLSMLFDEASWKDLLPRLSPRGALEDGLRCEAVLLRKDRGTFHATLSLRPVQRRDRKHDGYLVVVRDESERSELETKLREAETRYGRLVEGLTEGVVIIRDGRIIFANPALAGLLGAPAGDLDGRPLLDFVATRDVLQVSERISLLEIGSAEDDEIRFALGPASRGAEAVVRLSATRADFEGSPAVFGLVLDETAELRAQAELRRNEARLDAVVEASADGILALNETPDGGVVHLVNDAFLQMFGLRAEQVLGVSEATLILRLREKGSGGAAVAAFLASSGGAVHRETISLSGETPRELDVNAAPLRNRSGDVIGRIVACRDMTESRLGADQLADQAAELQENMERLEEAHAHLHKVNEDLELRTRELDQFNAELRKLDQMKSNLLANVSHELQTPLVSIRGYTEMILKGRLGPTSEEQRRGLELSLRNIDRLISMIDNLLEFSRMERETGDLDMTDFALEDLIRDCEQVLRPRLESKQIAWKVALRETGITIHGDREKIYQVFVNVLTNAIKYNRDGGWIEVRAGKKSPGFARVEVEDTGIGIPTGDLENIFDRFYQSEGKDGTGLGLSIVRNILRLHGCTIEVTSEQGKGTTVAFTLPLGENGGRRVTTSHPEPGPPAPADAPVPPSPPSDEPRPRASAGGRPRLRIIRPTIPEH